MKRFLLFSFFVSVAHFSLAQNPTFTYANNLGSTGDDAAQSIFTDASGNVYVAGSFSGTVDFSPGATTTNLTSAGDIDAFFAKYNSSGALVWVKRLGSTGADEVYGVSADASGNVYITGYFAGTVDFDPDAGTVNRSSTSATDLDIFFGKYSSTGALLWVNTFSGSSGVDYGSGITTDGAGNVFVTGAFRNTIDFDPSASTASRSSLGESDVFFGKYSTSGALLWVNTMGSTLTDFGYSIAADNSFVYLCGGYRGTMDVNPTTTVVNLTNLGDLDGFFAKYSTTTGALDSYGSVRSTGYDYVATIAIDASNFYITGQFSNTAGFFSTTGEVSKTSAGGTDLFVAKYTSATFANAWVNTIGSTNNEVSNYIALDASSNVYFTGYFSGTVDFNPGTTTSNLVSTSASQDAFMGKFTTSGAYAWAFGIGGTGVEQGTSVSVDASGNVHSAGIFQSSVDFDPGTGTSNVTSLGGDDAYFTKYAQTTVATEPTTQPTAFSAISTTSTKATISFTAAAPAPSGYLAVVRSGSAPTSDPVDGTAYALFTTLGNGIVVHSGPETTFEDLALTVGTQYFYKIYAYNGSGSNINYRQASPLIGNFTHTTPTLATEPTAQPTALVFNPVGSTSFTVSFTAASGVTGGYLGVASKTAAPTFVPVDGTTYTQGQDLGNDTFVSFVNTNTSYEVTGATPGTNYYYAIFAFNGTGAATNYRTTSPLTGQTTTQEIVDNTPPVVTDNTQKTVKSGETITISVMVTDASPISNVYVDYGPVEKVTNIFDYFDDQEYEAGTSIKVLTLTNTSGNIFTGEIPASDVGQLGVVYIVSAYDDYSNEYYDQASKVITLQIPNNGIEFSYTNPGTSANKYKLVSIPLTLEKKTVNDVFVDDLGPMDKKAWRMFRYQSGQNSELASNAAIEPGRGYWLISTKSATIDSGPGATVSVSVDKPFSVSLSSGWNLIGNPYPFNILWQDIVSANPGLSASSLRLFSEGTFSNGTVLRAFEGAFVMATSSGTLNFPVIKNPSAGRINTRKNNPLNSNDWEVMLSLSDGELTNNYSGFGMNENASDEIDSFDDYTSPRFIDFLELNHAGKFQNISVAKDIVKLRDAHTWSFEVNGSNNAASKTLTWDNSYFGDNDRQLILWDIENARNIDMRTTQSYTFEGKNVHHFEVYYGDKSVEDILSTRYRLRLFDVFPNPVMGEASVTFSVHKGVSNEPVELALYDALGRKVSVLMRQRLEPGVYQTQLLVPQNKESGIFLLRLTNGKQEDQKRIIIK